MEVRSNLGAKDILAMLCRENANEMALLLVLINNSERAQARTRSKMGGKKGGKHTKVASGTAFALQECQDRTMRGGRPLPVQSCAHVPAVLVS